MSHNNQLSPEQSKSLLETLKARFEENMSRHKDLDWNAVESKLDANPTKLWSLNELEKTDGEPDVVGYDPATDEFIFNDCSEETPAGRRNLCYDQAAWESRKEAKPSGNALDTAASMGANILTENEYRALQKLGEFDARTSSWIATPADIRELGGALFCSRRYGHVFVYHNGAESYYAARGFRCSLRV